ncbi:MAG: response regulator [Henriciella sp.]|uniref:PhyR family response regulator anti-anti-sigma factor n=1 Tax=Henriciella sp. TaxID=1968823 RepID=UPI003C765F99
MGIADKIEREMPFLRRYARAATGNSLHGDDLVERLLKKLIEAPWSSADRVSLFRDLDAIVADRSRSACAAEFGPLSTDSRRALLLSAMEGFALEDVAAIMRADTSQVTRLIAEAEDSLMVSLATDVFVIEDEPLVAAHIAQIATQMGHRVTGQASTRDSAVEFCLAHPPGLILADVRLADDSSGPDAVAAITREHDIPVIFITAYPQNLLQGETGEPAFLIPKPFRPDMVKAVISQALIQKAEEARAED